MHQRPPCGCNTRPTARASIRSDERALRAVAIGRKNYLHLGSDTGGASAAVFYTLIGTAKLNAIEPQAYLRYVLERIGEHPVNRVDDLLSWVVAERM